MGRNSNNTAPATRSDPAINDAARTDDDTLAKAPEAAEAPVAPTADETAEVEAKFAASQREAAEKVTVETTGEFMLVDPYTQEVIAADGTSEVVNSPFIDDKIASGQLKLA